MLSPILPAIKTVVQTIIDKEETIEGFQIIIDFLH